MKKEALSTLKRSSISAETELLVESPSGMRSSFQDQTA